MILLKKLIDMSGGVAESYALKDIRGLVAHNNKNNNTSSNSDTGQSMDHKTFWDLLDNAERKCSVIGCNIDVSYYINFKYAIVFGSFINISLSQLMNLHLLKIDCQMV